MDREPVGYAKPPAATRFAKGRSGNPKGRPKNRRRQLPHDAVLGQMVTIREDGRERRVTAAEAFLLQLTQKGLAGDSAAARASLEAIEAARASRGIEEDPIEVIILKPIQNGADAILDTLDLARLKYPGDEKRVRWEIRPWAVELALARMGSNRLTEEQQGEVWRNTQTPHKVRWPDWWIVRQ
ncbi:hypothetical protein GRI62_09980 [Erythrobacter arachoides]|uniref:DUF5681 domain-containing protein n=1 Tax=Aurantiacibacter arachoides TaxID=1850444 RepID=A0A845A1X2_9SPHN|nr:DUF5681 domain-containing protein [Aurantiacibacter arachoides]MXO93928.1 hypothetical protein [Aurantiacibacter arachoides]GGD45544.1 hypothetical protein GCM10011411_01400 [Aurantiacibacter arachoides]